MERLGRWLKSGKRALAGMMAVVLVISTIGIPVPVMGSEVWPQKSTAPYYCLDGGKGWKASDRYEIYQYHTLPSALTEIQAKRLFWAYPSSWNALKEAAAKYDPELYQAIASTGSNPNVVKKVKDDAGTKFAWVADHPEIEARAIAALEKVASENSVNGKEVPEPIRNATSEETAASFFVPAMCEGPGALDTEFRLSSAFIRDIAKIEAQSVWDNGSTGGNVGWLDASQDKNIAKAVMGEDLYEITWSGDSIKIHNNGSAVANENVVGSTMSEEEMYNKTTVRYKITMRENSGWYTDGAWNENYLTEWMDFKACVNAPGHQRLYKADIRIVPSDMVFYLVISQGPVGETVPTPEYGGESADVTFQVYRHEETFETNYNVKIKKLDDETGKPLKGSQFYLYERFEDENRLSGDEMDGGLIAENLSFAPWEGFQIFAEGTTDENGEISYRDTRNYSYSKTYCDGHGMPEWASVPEEGESENGDDETGEGQENRDGGENGEGESTGAESSGAEEARDQNRKAAEQWLDLFESCEEAAEESGGTHFHWQIDSDLYDMVSEIADSGEADEIEEIHGADARTAFRESGCEDDCEKTYEAFKNLRFTCTWKEVQARNGYILHDVHEADIPIHFVTTVSSEAGAGAYVSEGNSREIRENIWYSGNSPWTEAEAQDVKPVSQLSVPEMAESSRLSVLSGKEVWETGLQTDVQALDSSVQILGSNVQASGTSAQSSSSNAQASGSNALSSDSNALASDSDASEIQYEPTIFHMFSRLLLGTRSVDADDSEWEEMEGNGDFESYLDAAEKDGIRHLNLGESGKFSYAGPDSEVQDYWTIRDHRTEGEIHINKRDMDLYHGESEDYSSYGDTEGDSSLEGARYGLFAAEDIVHPDSELLTDHTMTNTGIVYKKNDLVSVAVTDADGNADFYTYTVAPGMMFNYENEQIEKRNDIDWTGPANLYTTNEAEFGNWWIGRPFILGSYYIKELSRSEGYELSVNGSSKEWTNYGSSLDTPASISSANGTAVISMPELAATMESEDETGNGYDQLTFSVTSSGTTDEIIGTDGYELIVSGFPEDTEFFRVDSGEMEVTGPHVTGTEEVVLKDKNGNIIWKTAEDNDSYVKYEPEYNAEGEIVGQIPMSRIEPQIQTFEQVPQSASMSLTQMDVDLTEELWNEKVQEHNLGDNSSDLFLFIKAELEDVLNQNGYDVPVTAEGLRSTLENPVFSVGVIKGQEDRFGMTTAAGQTAVKTVYGAAFQKVLIEDIGEDTTAIQLMNAILTWYQEHPQWSFGGIHEMEMTEEGCLATLYASASVSGSRRFFTMKEEEGSLTPGSVYAVLENPVTLRWEYQEYQNSGSYQYQIDRQYYLGSGTEKRYYMDVTLAPAVMIDESGDRQIIEHQVMVYHEAGEEIVDYMNGDPAYGYRVPLTETTEKIEITTEMEFVEQDIPLKTVQYDKKSGTHTIYVKTSDTDSFGNAFSDEEKSLTLTFMAKLPFCKKVLTSDDLEYLGNANVYGYENGEEIGFAEYLMHFTDAAISVNTGGGKNDSDTYIVQKRLTYRGQNKVIEDGNSVNVPVQVLERPIKQKVKVVKTIVDENAIGNFRFKIYLKSNLERLYCKEDGTITWLDRNGKEVDIQEYKNIFPELVQKLYTEKTERSVLEKIKQTVIDGEGNETKIDTYNYVKFFEAVNVANTDKWHNSGFLWNTSWKPFVKGLFSEVENTVNSSAEAKENAKRSDAVRQFAIDWYLEDEVEKLTIRAKMQEDVDGNLQAKSGTIVYADEIYDKALYEAILKAENYLTPFFKYDLDSIYEILWDSEDEGGVDEDFSTLTASHLDENKELAYGISEYLPYGTYVIAEQQPYHTEWKDMENRHYEIDTPKELSLPQYFDEKGDLMESSVVPWSVTEPGTNTDMVGYAAQKLVNKRYQAKLRIEKLDVETGEPILHEGAEFALYRAERDENGDGSVKRYEEGTIISGSKMFLEAMGAKNITTFARLGSILNFGVGMLYTGIVPAGTPICSEEDCVIFTDLDGAQTGNLPILSTVQDIKKLEIFQTTGYLETPEPVTAGVYVLAEVKVPAGYVRSKPIAIEVYSDGVKYYPDGGTQKAAAVSFGNYMDEEGTLTEKELETVRIYVNDTATSLEVSKVKTSDSYRGMKVSGRVEGSIVELKARYGLENLELAHNSSGTYLGFGWKKGTLEYLENRKAAGERVQIVYEAGVFQGYGYVTKILGTSDDEKRYVAGAQLALFEAIEVEKSGDSEDFAFRGVEVKRDRNGNVTEIYVKEGNAGERTDTPVLFYDLGDLEVLERSLEGNLYGYDRNGQKKKMTFDTKSIYALRNGQAVFEINGGNFAELIYDAKAKAFTKMDEGTVIYHLDQDQCRDAQVDGYTGLAYVEKSAKGSLGQEETHYYLWPVTVLRDRTGKVFSREKILTGRPGEKNSGTSQAYLTGTILRDSGDFEKSMNPILDENGLVKYYPASDVTYEKGKEVYDRDGAYVGYEYDNLLEEFNHASYHITEDPVSYRSEELMHREGESWIIPNIWISGEKTPQDPVDQEMSSGQADLLRRVVPGTYIMEEMNAPDGYVRSLPIAVCIEETADLQRVTMTDEKIKVEIAKVDGTEEYKKPVYSELSEEQNLWSTEYKGNYSGKAVENVELALFKAKRVYTSDYETYPKGYYLVKEENTPACWYTEGIEDNEPILTKGVWITGSQPMYFEGIPAGDYILEELRVPDGYLPASMEMTIKETSELQSFILMNDHTKLEVYKYEESSDGQKQPLEWPAEAELTLYPAVLDASGNVVTEQGHCLYEEGAIASWKTGNCDEYEKFAEVYEKMFRQYGKSFEQFSWNYFQGDQVVHGSAGLVDSHSTSNGETITQVWDLGNGLNVRVTVVRSDGKAPIGEDGTPECMFEYQFQYEEGKNEKYPELVSYDLPNGMHRLDHIPVGTYVLVETKTPDGYQCAEPKVIVVDETDAVQRVYLENKKTEQPDQKGTLVIKKSDSDNSPEVLSGAWFEVKNLQSGEVYRAVTGEDGKAFIDNLPITGIYESGIEGPCIYEVKEVLTPDGYQLEPVTRRIRFSLNESAQEVIYTLNVENKKTEFFIKKADFLSEHFVEGAELAIYATKLENGVFVPDGEALESWISTGEPHKVVGKLSGGRTYLLVEERAPQGYVLADPIRFTVSWDGRQITEIMDNMSKVQIHYLDGNNIVQSVAITGRVGTEMNYRLNAGQDTLMEVLGTGEEILWKEVEIEGKNVEENYLNEILVSEEELWFSDGSYKVLNRETFRVERDSRTMYGSSGSYPIGTDYLLLDADGVRLDKWSVTREQLTHEILNQKNQEGESTFSAGETYYLEEIVLFSDGSRVTTDRMVISLSETGQDSSLEMLNRETEVRIHKTDLTTGKELAGAEIVVKDLNGTILDEWVSGEEEHVIRGILIPGETYILSERMAADGYSYAEEIRVTVHENGAVERVVMEDRPTHVQIRKTDLTTGEELPGAKLTLKDEDGNIVYQWISGNTAHAIRGKLIAGATYTLIEETAPKGYLIAEEVTFTVSRDGTIDRIVMEDQREERPENPDDSDESEKPQSPETPAEPEYPEEPAPTEVPEEGKKIGRIFAAYETVPKKMSAFKLIQPVDLESVQMPQTGENMVVIIYAAGMLLSAVGLCWLNAGRGKKRGEQNQQV